jgi:hypothetical protein
MGHSVSVDTEAGYCILEEWQAREVLQHLYRQYRSVRKLASLLRVSKSTLHRCLKGEQSIPVVLRARLCEILSEEELLRILKGKDLLARYGLLDANGNINKPLAFAIVDALMQNQVAREEVLAYLLKYYKNGVSLMELKRAYELIRGGPVRKVTIAKALKQMIRKALIRKGEDGRYYPLVTKKEVAFTRIDRTRVRLQQPGRVKKKEREKQETSTSEKPLHEPYTARLAFNKARRIAFRYGSLAAAYFLAYSLIAVRETGFLLFWPRKLVRVL